MKTALLLIDIQQGLTSGQWAMVDAPAVIARANTLTRLAREHSIPVVVIQHEEPNSPMQYAAQGWQLAPELEVAPHDSYVRKTTPDSFHQTELHSLLQQQGIGHLVVCGFQTEFCIDTTVRRALALGYAVTLVADAHSTMDNGALTAAQIRAHHNETLSKMDSFGVLVRVQNTSAVQLVGA